MTGLRVCCLLTRSQSRWLWHECVAACTMKSTERQPCTAIQYKAHATCLAQSMFDTLGNSKLQSLYDCQAAGKQTVPGLHNNKIVSDILQQMFHMYGISLVPPGWLTLNITGGPCDVYTSKHVNSAFLSQATMLEASLYEQWHWWTGQQRRAGSTSGALV